LKLALTYTPCPEASGPENNPIKGVKAERRYRMRYYETLYLINPNLSDEEYGNTVTKFNSLVEKKKGVIIKVEEWGKKALAYEFKKFDKGYYVLLQYCGEGSMISEFEREMRLDEKILQHQTVKLADKADPDELKAKLEEEKVRPTEPSDIEDEEEMTEIDSPDEE
jgi:small subunit ribosomal protein S6